MLAHSGALVPLAPLRDDDGVAAGQRERGEGERGGEVEREVERLGDELDREEDRGDEDRGPQHRLLRYVVRVEPGEVPREVVVAGRGEDDVGGEQLPGEIGAEHRDDQADPDERPAPRTDRSLEHPAHRRLLERRDLLLGQDVVGQQRDRPKRASTERNPSTVARPTSVRRRA